jgi:hypothetical protein
MSNSLNWRGAGENPHCGPIRLLPDGNLAIGQMIFDKSCELEDCGIGGGVRVDFGNSRAKITAPDAIHHFRYVEGKGWDHAQEAKGSGGAWTWLVITVIAIIVWACLFHR